MSDSEAKLAARATPSVIAEMQGLIDQPYGDGDPGFGNGTVEELLEELGLVAATTPGTSLAKVHSEPQRSNDLGVRIGRFTLISLLGSGGFGIVFEAFDSELDRKVALKVLRPEAAFSPSIRRRFLREAKAAAQLEHSGIVAVHDVGRHKHLYYLASQLCEAGDLADWIANNPLALTPRQVALAVAQAAEAVQFAHARGVLHRDLKPSNILLKAAAVDDPLPFVPAIADFGLASYSGKEIDKESGETLHGVPMGTMNYMSPEQSKGLWKQVGVTTDVYSLGVVLYELLTGRLPFPSAKEIVNSDTKRPAAPSEFRSDLAFELDTICLKCLEPRPEDRYSSAGDLASDLRRFLNHQPILAQPQSTLRRLMLWSRRRPLVATLSMALSITLLVAGWVLILSYHRERRERLRAEENLAVARQAVSTMSGKIADNWLMNQPRAQGLRREVLEESLRFYDRIALISPHDARGQHDVSVALHRMANMFSQLNRYEEAVDHRERCLSILEELMRVDPGNERYEYDAFMNRMKLAGEYSAIGREQLAMPTLLSADAIIRKLVRQTPHDPVYEDALAALCVEIGRTLDAEAGERYLLEAAKLSEMLLEEHPQNPIYGKHAVMSYQTLATEEKFQEDEKRCRDYFRRAAIVCDSIRNASPDSRWTDLVAGGLDMRHGLYLLSRGDAPAAAASLERANPAFSRLIEWYPESIGHRENRCQLLLSLATAYSQLHRYAEASNAERAAQADANQILKSNPDNATAKRALDSIASHAGA